MNECLCLCGPQDKDESCYSCPSLFPSCQCLNNKGWLENTIAWTYLILFFERFEFIKLQTMASSPGLSSTVSGLAPFIINIYQQESN